MPHVQRRDATYPGGYVESSGAAPSTSSGQTGTGTYGYYAVNNNGTGGGGTRTSSRCTCRTPGRSSPDDQYRHPHRARGHSVVPQGLNVRSTSRSGTSSPRAWAPPRRPRRRKYEVVRQLGPLLRLDEVRARARLVRRRHVALSTVARHARLYNLNLSNMPGTTCGAASAIAACRTSTRSIRTSSRCSRTRPTSGLEYQLTPTTAFGAHYVHNKLTRAIEDVGRSRQRQRGLLRRQPGRRRSRTTMSSPV